MLETIKAEESRICSYSDIFCMGHKALSELFSADVVVEEKVDGSQFSFGNISGKILARSKGKQLVLDAPEKMFSKAVEQVLSVADSLPYDVIFRGEYLANPKHNTLAYSRVPSKNIIIFDIDLGGQRYLAPAQKKEMAAGLGFETVPTLYSGRIESIEQLKSLLPESSVLGGAKPEGIVIKNYYRYAPDKKVLMGKYVRPEFQEQHTLEWKKSNPSGVDVIQGLIASLKTEARWQKAAQHLRESGKIEGSPRDIGILLKEVEADFEKECVGLVLDRLKQWAVPKIVRGIKAGLPEWYKDQLLKTALFEANGGENA